ncbi:MAG: hypothetical protein N2C14_11025, partial [Planctomycetales bacterium]
ANPSVTSLRGTSVGENPSLTAKAFVEKHPLAKSQPWLRYDVALAAAPSPKVPFQIVWEDATPKETPLMLGGKFEARVKFIRPPGAVGPVRLTLVTGQPIPLVNGKPEANRAVRGAKPTVDVPIDGKAKSAADGLANARKTLAGVQAKAAASKELAAKNIAAALAVVQPIKVRREQAANRFKAAEVTAKQALEAQAVLAKELADAEAGAKSASDPDAKKQAETKVRELQAIKAASDKVARETEAEKKVAETALAAINKQLADAEAKATAVKDASEKTEAAARKSVADQETKVAAAETALQTAQANLKNVGAFPILVPANMTATSCDLTLRAELRALDNRTVLAEAFAAPRRFSVLNPLGLQLAETTFETQLDPKQGAVVTLTGTIERKAGFAGDVTVSIVGQPSGVAVRKTVLKPDKNDFELALKFPANFKPAEVKTIRLFASGPPDPKNARAVVRTEIPITIIVSAAEPAPQ